MPGGIEIDVKRCAAVRRRQPEPIDQRLFPATRSFVPSQDAGVLLGGIVSGDGPLDGDSVEVPDAGVMKRARELMDEIRRRAGERTRPEEELDYLRRLLERF